MLIYPDTIYDQMNMRMRRILVPDHHILMSLEIKCFCTVFGDVHELAFCYLLPRRQIQRQMKGRLDHIVIQFLPLPELPDKLLLIATTLVIVQDFCPVLCLPLFSVRGFLRLSLPNALVLQAILQWLSVRATE